MSSPLPHRGSWGSTSSTFSNIEMSFSHDSCYGSDEVSVTSNGNASGQQSSSTPAIKQSFRPFLKSILKNSSAVIESDGESDTESGYSSDGIDSDYDALSDEEEDDDDNMSDFSVWDETSQDVPETQEDHTDSFDDVFISFEENSVRFSPEVQYIDSPELSDDEAPDHQMTCHEMMMLARNSSGTQTLLDQLNRMDIEDEDEECHREFVRKSATQPDEFSRDAVDLDRSLFVAYMNGIHGVSNKNFEKQYKTYLQAQVGHIRLGKDIDCMSSDNASSLYLDLISSHVNGTFFNLLAEEELNELITLRAEEQIGDQNDPSSSALDLHHHQVLLKKIERFLTERLADGLVDVAPDELTLFAGGIVHDLGIKTPPAKV